MILKTKKTIQWPSRDKITDPGTLGFADDLGVLLLKTFRDVYDDLKNLLAVELVDALPTAGAEYRGKMAVLKGGIGVADAVYICLKQDDESYDWELL